MYKKQLSFQKLLCFLALGVSVAVFVYSLGIMTDLYDALYSTMRNMNDHTKTDVPGSIVYYNMQGFNRTFVLCAIGLILLAAALFVTNTHNRRKYYIANYLSTFAYAAAGIGAAVWSHLQIEVYKAQFLQIDFAALKDHAEMWDTYYTDSTFLFDIHYLLSGLLIAVAVLLVVNLFWKISLMKHETALLNGSAKG